MKLSVNFYVIQKTATATDVAMNCVEESNTATATATHATKVAIN
jgi:hypothetical protein